MILVPFPQYEKLKFNSVTVLLVLIIVSLHFLVVQNEVQTGTVNVQTRETDIFHQVQAQLYLNYLRTQGQHLDKRHRWIASIDHQEKEDHILSRISLQDPYFDPLATSAEGIDEVSYKHWASTYEQIEEVTQLNSASLLGVKVSEANFSRWVTYMFVHVGFYHLLSNVLFLFLFGALIEKIFGGLMVIVLFLGAGLVAVPVYLLLSGQTSVPLVGASGGVCGLIAFYCIYKFKEPLRFFFWVLPVDKYFGFIQISTGFVLLLWLLSDVAGYLSSVSFLESIAYGAHIGGFIAGTLSALGIIAYEKYIKEAGSGLKPPPSKWVFRISSLGQG